MGKLHMVDVTWWIWWKSAVHLKRSIPIGSMYAIYGNIYHQYAPNVTIYIHICHTWSIWEVDLLFSQKIHEIPVIEPTKMVSHGDAKNSMIPKDRAIPLVFYIYGNYIILYYIYN